MLKMSSIGRNARVQTSDENRLFKVISIFTPRFQIEID